MTGLFPLQAHPTVPFRDRVQPVPAVAAVEMDTRAGQGSHARGSRGPDAFEAGAGFGPSAPAAGFAAHILLEAGIAGADPSLAARAMKAYGAAPVAGRVRLVA